MRSRILPVVLFLSASLFAQRPNQGPGPRPNPELESALRQIIPITAGLREDDHPAIASRNGRVWVAWVSFSETENTTHIYARSQDGGKWSAPVQVSEVAGDYHKPAVTIDESNTVWVVWPGQLQSNWDIYGRALRGGQWGKTERLTSAGGPDLAPQLASSKAGVILVWQSMRRKNLDILYRIHNGSAWGKEGFVTENAANDWEPVVAATADGAFHVAWDSYRGDYDVILRTMRGGTWGAEMAVASSPKLENHASLTADAQNRVWIAWETGPENWAGDSADGGLRARRDIGLACLENGKLSRAVEAEQALVKLGGAKGMQAPTVAVLADGRMRLLFRQPANTNWLTVGITEWDGGGWSKPVMLPNSEGRIDQRIVVASTPGGVLACYPAGSAHNTIYTRAIESGGAGGVPRLTPADGKHKPAAAAPARHMLNGYQLVWGDLHRHTDISEDGGIVDGSLMDAMRYSLDVAELDFIGITDHTRYLPRRYNLWRIQQIADLLYQPGRFSPMHAYERSQYTPWGHRNVIHANRNYTPVPGSYDLGDPGVSPFGLFAALRGKKAMSIPHTSAWGNKQVSWEYNDPDIERIVEIYQGLRSTYEYNGAPDPAGREVYEKDSQYFVRNALERKLKLGFIASSDHRSTHMSFAAVYTKGIDRDSVFEGLQARRTFAATDKILLDFSIGKHLMGEEMTAEGTPEMTVAVEGTAAVAQVDIIKNGKIVYTTNPGQKSVRFTFRDAGYQGEDAYYYARVIQADKNMAWASPIWVRRK